MSLIDYPYSANCECGESMIFKTKIEAGNWAYDHESDCGGATSVWTTPPVWVMDSWNEFFDTLEDR